MSLNKRLVARTFSKPYKQAVKLTVIYSWIDKGLSLKFIDDMFQAQLRNGDARKILHSKDYARWLNECRNCNIPEEIIRWQYNDLIFN